MRSCPSASGTHLRTLSACVLLILSSFTLNAQRRVSVASAEQLQQLFKQPVESLEVFLQPGHYRLTPEPILDSTCGNCESVQTPVHATAGLYLRGRFIRIVGPADRSAILHTNAGYGLFVNGCARVEIEHLSITGGVRDTAGNATDAAIVVKHGNALIRNNRIFDNIGDSALVSRLVVGIMGIAGREGAAMEIRGNEIIRNSWDGIALYHDAEALIEDNVVDGVDKATGQRIGGGRGVGIGVTWNGKATIRRNLVKRYWKGIGLFVDASGVVEQNIVEDIITWGIQLWDAGKGKPSGRIAGNVIYNTGACGAAITRTSPEGEPGLFVANIIIRAAQNPRYDAPDYYCYQCALALHAVPKTFRIESNLFYNNRRATPDLPDYDMPQEVFREAIQPRLRALSEIPHLRSSDFVKHFSTN